MRIVCFSFLFGPTFVYECLGCSGMSVRVWGHGLYRGIEKENGNDGFCDCFLVCDSVGRVGKEEEEENVRIGSNRGTILRSIWF